MFKLRQKFNLVEVAIAIGILAIGVTAIISLFPVGFDRNKDAIGENYCADAADSLFAYIARAANSTQSGEGWNNIITTSLTSEKADIADTSRLDDGFSFESGVEGDIYLIEDIDKNNNELNQGDGIYGIKVMTGDVVDFTGEAVMWKTNIPALEISGEPVSVSADKAVAINLEISWPVEKPYSKRKRNYYYFELHNSNN